ncbi:phosphatidylserine/phosphatidylglycerophosphate/cardiolipin synthase family protein [Rhizobium gallicum]|uniref:phosphatidylserine/phosphatidylglycerophosphate/ cardiolipin synthase family protein n=1 Tax=Rhizobium gallicum TaxID=56730 RepID=UPI001EF7B830|nr:phosphatidylserine/phosphatidylglycerophosphate/cardiolipin synthase family protein [Rhizobium gallicum]ULJ73610.1 phosphatidylserine/phosphatidylglycerophosphate/cardiolipin synthase family protein [Rhizobium gallicum]
MNWEQLYIALGRTAEEKPDPQNVEELLRWIGRARALVEKVSKLDAAEISAATTVRLHQDPWALRNMTYAALYRALAVAELNAPVSAQGAFIPAGNALDAMAAIGKVLQDATKSVLLVDPYMDQKTLTDFVPLASEGISVSLLSDAATAKPTFSPAVARFKQQFGDKRPMEARLAAPRALHDRLIVVDQTTAFAVTQSFNALADRSHASIVRVDPETAALKVDAYSSLWDAAAPI